MYAKALLNWKNKEKKYNYASNHNQFLFFLIIFLLSSYNSFSKQIQRNLNSHFSKINLVIQGTGNQDLLYSGFMPGPSEVYVNGISQNGTCDKKCFLEEEISNVALVFEEKLTDFNSMFYKLNNIILNKLFYLIIFNLF